MRVPRGPAAGPVAGPPAGPVAGPPAGSAPVRPATMLLRDLLDVTDAFEKSLGASLSVNPTDLDAMQHLIMSGPLSPTELARRLGRSTAATTTSIDRLVALGHATREPNPQDRRGVRVVPSPVSSVKAMGRIMPMIMSIDETLDEFDEVEQQVITRYLARVVDEYRQHTVDPEDEATAGAPGSTASDGPLAQDPTAGAAEA